MAKRNHSMTQSRCCMVFLIVIAHILLNNEFIEARKIASVKNAELVKHKGTVKTIKSEDGDVIDCVDIYKQPAFDHPLLKNHTIEMKPSSYPRGITPMNFQPKIAQSLQKNGQCPEGTIPIRRAHKLDFDHAKPFITQHSPHLHQSNSDSDGVPREYAQVTQLGGNYYGARATLNVWNPKTEISGELSTAQIWLFSDLTGNTNTIEAGWMVLPEDNDNKTRFFIYWTSDNYQNTGCYNLDCPGFVLTSTHYIVGGPISPVSGYNSPQYDVSITIYKTGSGNWWLMVQDHVMGYWPGSIFTSLAYNASAVSWGGEVMNSRSKGRHTSTQMGSGHFPNEGYGKSSYFQSLGIVDQTGGTMRDPEKLEHFVTYPTCYDLHVEENNTSYGTYFYYGGPGYSEILCP